MKAQALISPLAPAQQPVLPPINGVRISSVAAGLRYKGRNDILLAEFCEGTQAAGVFTRSKTAAANILAARESLKSGQGRALLVNAGNANAFTGSAGEGTLTAVSDAVCAKIGCKPEHFYMGSTGVIGERLPAEKITTHIDTLFSQLGDDDWDGAAEAIMTTDTYLKKATRQCELGGKRVTINGIAKGSGMIAPDMATMLGYLFTDAAIDHAALQPLLADTCDQTFNAITVDGDTSTSDMLLLFATGKAGNAPITKAGDPALEPFKTALFEVMHELALHIVKDGEGAQKLVRIQVTGAEHDAAARIIGKSIANSPLVKTALSAGDANWGRIVMAVGKAGEAADRDKLTVKIGGVMIAREGEIDPDYKESLIDAHMKGRDIFIEVDVGIANGQADVWTCDLTHRYIDINASYRT